VPAVPDSAPPATLYDRMGGRPVLLKLLKHFYADVRQHAEIAPIFAAKIADFRSGLTGGPRLYTGGMPWKHVPLRLEERHFFAWLELWRRNCRIYLSADVAEDMIAAAESLGLRLRQIVAEYGARE
jgi:hemoglobin